MATVSASNRTAAACPSLGVPRPSAWSTSSRRRPQPDGASEAPLLAVRERRASSVVQVPSPRTTDRLKARTPATPRRSSKGRLPPNPRSVSGMTATRRSRSGAHPCGRPTSRTGSGVGAPTAADARPIPSPRRNRSDQPPLAEAAARRDELPRLAPQGGPGRPRLQCCTLDPAFKT
jgi:hypothetical protein